MIVSEDSVGESNADVAGVIIAGGQGSRLGYADKPLLLIDSRPILEYLIDSAAPQVGKLFLNVNRNPESFTNFGLNIRADKEGNGPLAGVLAGMEAAAGDPGGFRYLACFPGDTPWFPDDIVTRLRKSLENSGAEIAWLQTSGQLQPLFSLWRVSLLSELEAEVRGGAYSPRYFIQSRKHILLPLHDLPPHYFLNINDDEGLRRARGLRDSSA